MSAIRKATSVTLMRINHSSAITLPIPTNIPTNIPVEIENKPYLRDVVQIPTPYCHICNSFLQYPFCNKMIQPKSCPMGGD